LYDIEIVNFNIFGFSIIDSWNKRIGTCRIDIQLIISCKGERSRSDVIYV